jgi:hypothetical protein
MGRAMITCVYDSDWISVPSWVVDLETFRRWADGSDFPEKARIWYLKGEVWIDLSREELFTHVLLKSQFAIVLGGLVRDRLRSGQLALFLRWGR